VGRFYLKKEEKASPVKIADGIVIGRHIFSIENQLLRFNDETIELSAKEAKLLSLFAERQNQLITREELLKKVWEDEGVITGRSLDMFISKLRKKLKNDPSVQLINVHGKGYKLEIL
jgi:DNA-binding response OmpR family regulator